MQTVTDYEKQAEDFLSRHSLTFAAVLVGSDCPKFCEDAAKGKDMDKTSVYPRKSHIHGKHYRCTILRRKASASAVVFDFWNSYADEEFNALGDKHYRNGETPFKFGLKGKAAMKTPTAYDLLACVEKSDPGTFDDFCGNFVYDSDSRKAFDVYLAVQEEYRKITRFLTPEEIEEMQEIS